MGQLHRQEINLSVKKRGGLSQWRRTHLIFIKRKNIQLAPVLNVILPVSKGESKKMRLQEKIFALNTYVY